MLDYFIYYTESCLVCVIFFAIMLGHDLLNVDRQEKMIKYDNALVAFMLYFVSDAFWAAIIAGIVPRNLFTVVLANFSNYLLMAAITYAWLEYVMTLESSRQRPRPVSRRFMILPFVLATIALILTYLFARDTLIDEALNVKPLYYAFLVTVPIIYIIAVVLFTVRRARHEENPEIRRRHLFVGFFPLIVIIGGLFQVMVLPNTPIFCYASTVLMLIFYIQSMETQISLDPLTGLNNRGQLYKYISQKSNLHIEGRKTYAVMIDVNDFKMINDTYGHAEGDRALVIIADALKNTTKHTGMPVFVSRYGGDEFILIAHPAREEELQEMIHAFRNEIESEFMKEETPYMISVGIGYDELKEGESFQDCMERADEKLYLDKKSVKAQL